MRTSKSNMEHYRNKILEILKDGESFGIVDGEPVKCDNNICQKCDFYNPIGVKCRVSRTIWMMEDYKPEITLTAREKHFVEFTETGWIARNEDGRLSWWTEKPRREETYWWGSSANTLGYYVTNFFDDMFEFVTWEGKKPWSVEDLRKLKVKDE